MESKQTKSTFTDKISRYFRGLCSGSKQQKGIEKEVEHKTQSKKKVRLTFLLDRSIIKLSRRNVMEDEFMISAVLSTGLQKYLGSRMSSSLTVLLKGQFTQHCINCIPIPIVLNISQQFPKRFRPNNEILISNKKSFKMRNQAIDTVLLQIYYGAEEELDLGETCNEVDEIEKLLKFYHGNVQNFAFICSNNPTLEEFQQLFVVFKDTYMFQIQKIMVRDKHFCTIVYLSDTLQFLKIQENCLIDFLVEEIIKKQSFTEEKPLKLLLQKLFAKQLHLAVCNTLGQLKISKNANNDYFQQFVYEMSQRYESSVQILKADAISSKFVGKKTNPKLSMGSLGYQCVSNTPLFNYEFMHSFADDNENQFSPEETCGKVAHNKSQFPIRSNILLSFRKSNHEDTDSTK